LSAPSSTPLGFFVPLAGVIVSAFGTGFTIFFSWRKDWREKQEWQLKIIELEQKLGSHGSVG
jgi:hypothetical protein